MPTYGAEQISSLSLTYAQALLELADESRELDALAPEAQELGRLIDCEPDLRRLLENRILSIKDRARVLTDIFRGRVSDLLLRFIMVVNQKQRLHELRGILRAFEYLVEQRNGKVEVDAYVAQQLPPAEAAALAARLGQALKREVQLEQHVDPELIGGLKLRIGDQLIDGSVAAQLRLLRHQMVEAGRAQARVAASDQ